MSEIPYAYGLAHRFVVEVGDIRMSFSKISGLELELEFESYQEGGVNSGALAFPNSIKSGNLVLESGVGNVSDLIKWFNEAMSGKFVSKTVTIKLKDAHRNVVQTWQIADVLPVKWSGPSFDASGQQVAIEVVELMYGSIKNI